MPDQTSDTYVLGTHEEELRRLKLQHRLWRAVAHDLWERAGFRSGQTLADVGAGPGYATQDLAELVGPQGRVIAIELSRSFAEYLQAQGIGNVSVMQADAQEVTLLNDSLDGAFARWVFSFVHHPERVAAVIARALRPGAAFAVQEYVSYRGARLGPPSPALERVLGAITASWAQRGGDAEIGCRIPAVLEGAGFTVREMRPIARLARPLSALWEWPTTFFHNVLPSLVTNGFLGANDAQAFLDDWAERTQDPNAFFFTPVVLDVIAQKPG